VTSLLVRHAQSFITQNLPALDSSQGALSPALHRKSQAIYSSILYAANEAVANRSSQASTVRFPLTGRKLAASAE
jgi:hypothetical protein